MSGVGMLARLDADAAVLRLRLQGLTRQVSSGQRAETPGDLAPELTRAMSLRSEVARRGTYGEAIGSALGRTTVAQSALKRLGEIAGDFASGTLKLDTTTGEGIALFAQRARQALVEVGHLLNTQHAGEYLFGGSDSTNPPVPDPEGLPTAPGGMAQRIAAEVATLGGGNAAAVAAATRNWAGSDSAGVTPFSAYLSDPAAGLAEPRRSVPAGDGTLVAYGLFANRNAGAASTGETTGSWSRDLMRGLASLAALTPAQAAAAPADLAAFVGTVRDGLKSASSAIADEGGGLGLTEQRLESARSRHAEIGTTLESQLADIQEVDLAETLTRLQATQTALEASYTAIGRIGSLSLTQFLR